MKTQTGIGMKIPSVLNEYKNLQKIETASTRQFSSHISKERFEAYQRMGLQFKEIAEEFHITTTALQQWRKDNGYPIYNKNNKK